jgi:osmoprotectant transport system permease protein
LLAIIVGVPLGIVASRGGAIGQAILAFTSAVQTIPSLALLALLVPVPFFGISARTAIAALFLYGLLPIVRNTATGLQDIAPSIRESAIALGLTPGAQLRRFTCRSLHGPSSPASKPARSSASAPPRSRR